MSFVVFPLIKRRVYVKRLLQVRDKFTRVTDSLLLLCKRARVGDPGSRTLKDSQQGRDDGATIQLWDGEELENKFYFTMDLGCDVKFGA